jgi:hypothetical protein
MASGGSIEAQAAKSGPTAQVAPMAPSAQSLTLNAAQSSQASYKTAPSVQSLQPTASQPAASQAALQSAPAPQSLSMSVVQGSMQAATLPETKKLDTAQTASVLPAQSATREGRSAMTEEPASQSAPSRMRLASLEQSPIVGVQAAVEPKSVGAPTRTKTMLQGESAPVKAKKPLRSAYSATRAKSFSAQMQNIRGPHSKYLKSKAAKKK